LITVAILIQNGILCNTYTIPVYLLNILKVRCSWPAYLRSHGGIQSYHPVM